MKYIVESAKTVEQAAADLEAAVKANSFGVLHVHNISGILNSKGFEFADECRVFEVCNPKHAFNVLGIDMDLNMALPCRISVWSQNGQTKIGMINPQTILATFSDDEALNNIAVEVEAAMQKMIDTAK